MINNDIYVFRNIFVMRLIYKIGATMKKIRFFATVFKLIRCQLQLSRASGATERKRMIRKTRSFLLVFRFLRQCLTNL